jgi:hypothetical protein
MLLVIVTLLVALIILPLIDLITAERIRYLVKIVILAATALWELFEIFIDKVRLV